jgi:hypothetical protein
MDRCSACPYPSASLLWQVCLPRCTRCSTEAAHDERCGGEERSATQHVSPPVPTACCGEKSITPLRRSSSTWQQRSRASRSFWRPRWRRDFIVDTAISASCAASTWDLPPRSVARSAPRDSGSSCMTRGRMHSASAPRETSMASAVSEGRPSGNTTCCLGRR